jgi:FkbM family methyltransferase
MDIDAHAVPNAGPIFEKVPKRGLLKSLIKNTLVFAAKNIYWKPIKSAGKYGRVVFFDSAEPDTLLLTTIGEEKFLVSSSDQSIGRDVYLYGGYDFEKFEKVLARLDKEFERKLLIDIGANIGTICIPAVKRRYFERAMAFEPEPFNYSLLSANVSINGLSTEVVSYNIALGEREGEELSFELSETNYGDHRIRFSSESGLYGEDQRKVINIKSEPLDTVVGDIDPASTLIWMDTQGFEGYVLKGAERTLAKRPPLVIEFSPYHMIRCGSYQKLKQALCGVGYRMFFDLDEDGPPIEVSEAAFDNLFKRIGEYGNYTDLLIV